MVVHFPRRRKNTRRSQVSECSFEKGTGQHCPIHRRDEPQRPAASDQVANAIGAIEAQIRFRRKIDAQLKTAQIMGQVLRELAAEVSAVAERYEASSHAPDPSIEQLR